VTKPISQEDFLTRVRTALKASGPV
jgi:hypothetical protein